MDPDYEWKLKAQAAIQTARLKQKTNDDNLPIMTLPTKFVVELARNEEEIANWVTNNQIRFLGVDLEWKADFNVGGVATYNPACFLQLSTLTSCLIIDLREMKNCNSPSIANLFGNEKIPKVVIGSSPSDRQKFCSFFPKCEIKTWVDLGALAVKENFPAPGIGPKGQIHGVRSLCASVLKRFYVNTPELTFTNWSAVEIDAQHLNYMALDAWICARVYYELLLIHRSKTKSHPL